MAKFYVTVASNMPRGAGYYQINASSQEEARDLAFAHIPAGRWSFMYDTLDEIHPLDRKFHGEIGAKDA